MTSDSTDGDASTSTSSTGGTLVLLVVLVLNVYKPPGLTPYGWRKQDEERRGLQRSRLTARGSPSPEVDR